MVIQDNFWFERKIDLSFEFLPYQLGYVPAKVHSREYNLSQPTHAVNVGYSNSGFLNGIHKAVSSQSTSRHVTGWTSFE